MEVLHAGDSHTFTVFSLHLPTLTLCPGCSLTHSAALSNVYMPLNKFVFNVHFCATGRAESLCRVKPDVLHRLSSCPAPCFGVLSPVCFWSFSFLPINFLQKDTSFQAHNNLSASVSVRFHFGVPELLLFSGARR